ncbi:MAG TPA: hypothetical protein VMR75_00770 [Candidatus Saccharimonadales bacterium]|nr:hypothetical protein [Candidatus Saccharimonadales bacterium]
MTFVPTKSTIIAGMVSLAVIGAVFTLVHRSAGEPASYKADSSTSTDGSPMLASQGVVENPPVSVTVNGETVPAKPGTTRVDTPGGSATVQVSPDSTAVDTQTNHATSSTPEGSLNVSVSSSSSGSTADSSNNVYTSSQTTVSGSGSSVVDIQTNNSN